MAQLNPYLNFNGRCREAMNFYQTCLGGELNMQKISESPMAAQLTSEARAAILHSTLVSGNIVLMGSDMIGKALKSGNEITLCLTCASDDEIRTYFDSLASGGEVGVPLHQTFWGATHGELTDKFGIRWMFSYSKT